MANFIVGTAGHVDHGKTTLIKALTGIDTDRLKEEKERGMSIELGFAYLDLPEVGRVGIVDVPGHERFLKNMLRGATGVDIALLVVAADEGVMPQTREHLNILNLLNIKTGLIAITKMDAVEDGMIELVADECRRLAEGTFLEGCPIVPVSAVSGQNLDKLKMAIGQVAAKAVAKRMDLPFRLPVDRVFTIKGSGTVVTGTVMSGKVRPGESVQIMPSGMEARVRGVEVHSETKDEAQAGQRAALNLARVGKDGVSPGDVVGAIGYLRASSLIDGRLKLLKGCREVKNWTRVRVYAGAVEVLGRVSIIDKPTLKGGDRGLVQLNLESPVALRRGDAFIIRLYSPMHLLGGGVVMDPIPPKHRRGDRRAIERLDALEKGDARTMIETLLLQGPKTLHDLAYELELTDVGKYVDEMSGDIASLGPYLLHRKLLSRLEEDLAAVLVRYSREYPLRSGMPKEELKSKLGANSKIFPTLGDRFWDVALDKMSGIELKGDKVALKGSKATLSPEHAKMKDEIERAFLAGGFSPPSVEEIRGRYKSSLTLDIIQSLVEASVLVRLSQSLIIHIQFLDGAKGAVRKLVEENGAFTVSQFRDALGTTRKYAVPILEHLDSIRYTLRMGDERVLAKK
jgi:selenocysteine-specific elongation factor